MGVGSRDVLGGLCLQLTPCMGRPAFAGCQGAQNARGWEEGLCKMSSRTWNSRTLLQGLVHLGDGQSSRVNLGFCPAELHRAGLAVVVSHCCAKSI